MKHSKGTRLIIEIKKKKLKNLTYHKLHVAGSGGLSAGRGDLLGEVGGGHDLLGQGDTVVLQEDDLELVADVGVVVHHLGHPVEQLDDLLGSVIPGGGFST